MQEARNTGEVFTVSGSQIYYNDNFGWTTALHEIGHSLGIDHCFNKTDTMFITSTYSNGLTDRDINTISLLYDGIDKDTTPPDTFILRGHKSKINYAEFHVFAKDNLTPFANMACQYRIDDGNWINGPDQGLFYNWNQDRWMIQLENIQSGKHIFSVRAIDNAGNVDPTPATWTILVGDKPGLMKRVLFCLT